MLILTDFREGEGGKSCKHHLGEKSIFNSISWISFLLTGLGFPG